MTTQSEIEEDPQVTRAQDRVGMVLQEKWTLEAILGVGGMAAVYAATHRNGKRVAVKMLHAEFSHDDEVRTRFLREGYAANTIQHEGAVSVLDDDLAPDGSAFIVMELLEGETVERRWERRGGHLPVTEVLFIADQLLDVLTAAHDKSVVHRDIKPENLFITRAGGLKVLDFGIAKVFERQTRATSTRAGMIMGTPAFMAPEQARGRWEEVDARTDLWAVGATMFTLLTGRHVHEAESSQEQLIASATVPAPPLASVAPEVPPLVAAIVDRALAFDRANRWSDSPAMQKVVREAIEAAGALLPPVSGVSTLASGRLPAPRTTLRSDAGILSGPGGGSAVPTWSRDRDARAAETVRLRAIVQDLSGKYAAAKKHAAEASAAVEAAQAERASLAEWFHRRAGTRTAAVEEARADVRRSLVAIARRGVSDQASFGADFDAGRGQLATLERAAQSAARDVTVHEAALVAYEPKGMRTGLLTAAIAALLALALVVAPIVWRATRVIEPPIPHSDTSLERPAAGRPAAGRPAASYQGCALVPCSPFPRFARAAG
jgi:serine/threonine-protein kinase